MFFFLWNEIMQNVVLFSYRFDFWWFLSCNTLPKHAALDVCYFRILSEPEVSAFCVLTSRPKKKKKKRQSTCFNMLEAPDGWSSPPQSTENFRVELNWSHRRGRCSRRRSAKASTVEKLQHRKCQRNVSADQKTACPIKRVTLRMSVS